MAFDALETALCPVSLDFRFRLARPFVPSHEVQAYVPRYKRLDACDLDAATPASALRSTSILYVLLMVEVNIKIEEEDLSHLLRGACQLALFCLFFDGPSML